MRRIRLALVALALLLLLGVGALVYRALASIETEKAIRHEVLADRLFDEVERSLTGLIEREEARSPLEYRFFYVPEGQIPGSGGLVLSPLAGQPAQDYVLGYFQVEPDGQFQSPRRPRDTALASSNNVWNESAEVFANESLLRSLTQDLQSEAQDEWIQRQPSPEVVELDEEDGDAWVEVPPEPTRVERRTRAETKAEVAKETKAAAAKEKAAPKQAPAPSTKSPRKKGNYDGNLLDTLNQGAKKRASRQSKSVPLPTDNYGYFKGDEQLDGVAEAEEAEEAQASSGSWPPRGQSAEAGLSASVDAGGEGQGGQPAEADLPQLPGPEVADAVAQEIDEELEDDGVVAVEQRQALADELDDAEQEAQEEIEEAEAAVVSTQARTPAARGRMRPPRSGRLGSRKAKASAAEAAAEPVALGEERALQRRERAAGFEDEDAVADDSADLDADSADLDADALADPAGDDAKDAEAPAGTEADEGNAANADPGEQFAAADLDARNTEGGEGTVGGSVSTGSAVTESTSARVDLAKQRAPVRDDDDAPNESITAGESAPADKSRSLPSAPPEPEASASQSGPVASVEPAASPSQPAQSPNPTPAADPAPAPEATPAPTPAARPAPKTAARPASRRASNSRPREGRARLIEVPRAPDLAERAVAVDAEVSPLRGRRLDDQHVLLHRKVQLGELTYRQGFVVQLSRLAQALEAEVVADELADLIELRWWESTDAADGFAYAFPHAFEEPFAQLATTVLVRPLPEEGISARQLVLVLALLLGLLGLLGFYAVYRMVAVVVHYAERRNNFVAAVSHELKTPLTAIRMYGEILREGMVTTDEKKQEYYGTITAESERLSRLIDNVLELSKLEKGSRVMNATMGSVVPILDETVRVLGPHARKQGFDLRLEADDDLPNATFDRDALTQVVINLVDNALKFSKTSPTKEVVLQCQARDGQVVLRIRDHGPGVPQAQLRRIFQPFFRGERELTRKTKGTGIGLALVKGLVEEMGGEVDARNHPDGGFVVEIGLKAA